MRNKQKRGDYETLIIFVVLVLAVLLIIHLASSW